MNILFICTTPYHIMVSTNLKMTIYKDCISDIVITDAISNYSLLIDNLKESGIYRDVFSYKRKDYEDRSITPNNFFYKFFLNLSLKIKPYFTQVNIIFNDMYDQILLPTNYEWVKNQIVRNYRKISEKKGKNFSLYLFEDGTSAYSKENKIFFEKLKNGPAKFLRNLTVGEYKKTKGLYVFIPDLMEWKPNFPVFSIEKFSKKNINNLNIINKIFKFDQSDDKYDKDYIFFEDCYFADGKDIGDMEVMNDLIDIIGKNEIYVKIHPRNPINRFKEIGVKTNTNTEIPWEVIALNMNLEDKVLITISSSAVLNILSNINVRPKLIIMLTEYEKVNKQFLHEVASGFQMTLADINNDIIKRPKTYTELAKLLTSI